MAAEFGERLDIRTVVVAATSPVVLEHLLHHGRVHWVVDRRLVVAVVEDMHGAGDLVDEAFLCHPIERQRVVNLAGFIQAFLTIGRRNF